MSIIIWTFTSDYFNYLLFSLYLLYIFFIWQYSPKSKAAVWWTLLYNHPPMCFLFCCVIMTAYAHEINQIRKFIQVKIILSRRDFFFKSGSLPWSVLPWIPKISVLAQVREHKEQKWRARNQGLTHSVLLLNMLLWIMSYKSVHASGNPTYESLSFVFLCPINSI